MERIDRRRLASATYPRTFSIQTRFDDLDVLGHINNAAAVVMLQEARVALNHAAGLAIQTNGLRTMVASLTVDYADEMHYPAPIEISLGVLALGRTSFTIAQIARQDGTARIFAQVVMVIADASGPTPIPDALRATYQSLALAWASDVCEM